MANILAFFAEKNVSSFCIAKATFLQQKNQCIGKYLSYNSIANDALNNWALHFKGSEKLVYNRTP